MTDSKQRCAEIAEQMKDDKWVEASIKHDGKNEPAWTGFEVAVCIVDAENKKARPRLSDQQEQCRGEGTSELKKIQTIHPIRDMRFEADAFGTMRLMALRTSETPALASCPFTPDKSAYIMTPNSSTEVALRWSALETGGGIGRFVE